MRKIQFANGEYYHLYNRGVDKRKVFLSISDYERFLLSMDLLNDQDDGLMTNWKDFRRTHPRAELSDFPLIKKKRKRLVEFIFYCLNPNHYHVVVRQLAERGIERFMHKMGTSYTNYFNTKNTRDGVLFQGKFKAIHIKSNAKLLYLSAYVNMNNFIHGYRSKDWEYSSLLDYLGKRDNKLCNKEVILGQFKNKSEYKEFVNKNSLYMKERKEEEKYLLE
jgi:putative transposase